VGKYKGEIERDREIEREREGDREIGREIDRGDREGDREGEIGREGPRRASPFVSSAVVYFAQGNMTIVIGVSGEIGRYGGR
jgi:hypothetical protein